MHETIRLDGVDIPLTKESISALLIDYRQQLTEFKGRLDAMGLELEHVHAAKVALEDPKAINAKVQSRITLMEQCRKLLGDDASFEGKSDEDLKLLAIKHRYPNVTLDNKDQIYLDGMFTAILASMAERNDSLTSTREAIQGQESKRANVAYESWIEQSSKLWTIPLTGSVR